MVVPIVVDPNRGYILVHLLFAILMKTISIFKPKGIKLTFLVPDSVVEKIKEELSISSEDPRITYAKVEEYLVKEFSSTIQQKLT